MQIYGTSQLHGAQSISGPHIQRTADARPAASNSPVDSLDLSPTADLVGQVNDLPAIRQDRVAALKAAINAGTYETSDKLGGAVDRLLDEIG